MDEKQYFEERVEDQEQWYNRKSQWNQWWYKRLGIVQIVSAAIVPFLAGMQDNIDYTSWIIGALGIVIAVTSASSSMFKFQENWIQTVHISMMVRSGCLKRVIALK